MKYISTRGDQTERGFSDILLEGLAPDGGLYLPKTYPRVDAATLARWRGLAYADLALADMRKAAQADPKLASGRYSVRLAIQVAADGRIAQVRLLGSSGDAKRDQALERRLAGLQLSQRPPDGMPVLRIELNTAAGA